MIIKNNSTVLFQGDSVTDAGRVQNNDLGFGYPMFAASWFSAMHPEVDINFINRGIGGNKSEHLLQRWKEDCIDLKPDIVSILIGINDCWRRYDSNITTTAEEFYGNCKKLIVQTKENTDAKIILMEPFLLPVPEDRKEWRVDLDPKINAIRDLAREFKLLLIPLDGIFNKVSALKGMSFWTEDGVHPTLAGHALIAGEWLQAIEAL